MEFQTPGMLAEQVASDQLNLFLSVEEAEALAGAAESADYLRGRLKRALDELAGIDPDVILTENVDVVVASLLGKHMPTEIKIDWDGATRTP